MKKDGILSKSLNSSLVIRLLLQRGVRSNTDLLYCKRGIHGNTLQINNTELTPNIRVNSIHTVYIRIKCVATSVLSCTCMPLWCKTAFKRCVLKNLLQIQSYFLKSIVENSPGNWWSDLISILYKHVWTFWQIYLVNTC